MQGFRATLLLTMSGPFAGLGVYLLATEGYGLNLVILGFIWFIFLIKESIRELNQWRLEKGADKSWGRHINDPAHPPDDT